jgi:hypothetical protein
MERESSPKRFLDTGERNTGFFQNSFTLPPYPEIGVWTARSFYNGRVKSSILKRQ